jgi:signal transduction histidine kinase
VLARAQTRAELPQRDSIRLRPLLEEVASQVEPQPDVTLELRCDEALAALGDRDLAEQALRNLAENAAKNTRKGSIVISAERQNGTVQIAVRDTGPGVPPWERERVFDRFYRGGARDADGFGLGLAIVRQAVRVLGGGIELESTPHVGTTVTITLPSDEGEGT